VFFLNHGEEQLNLIHKMALRTQHGNGLTNQHRLHKSNKDIHTIIQNIQELKILVIKASMKKFGGSQQLIRVYFLNLGEDKRRHIHLMVSKTQHGNGLINHLH